MVKMNASKSTLCIIVVMEVPIPIGVYTVNPLSEKSLIWTCINDSMKYQITQYDHFMDH